MRRSRKFTNGSWPASLEKSPRDMSPVHKCHPRLGRHVPNGPDSRRRTRDRQSGKRKGPAKGRRPADIIVEVSPLPWFRLRIASSSRAMPFSLRWPASRLMKARCSFFASSARSESSQSVSCAKVPCAVNDLDPPRPVGVRLRRRPGGAFGERGSQICAAVGHHARAAVTQLDHGRAEPLQDAFVNAFVDHNLVAGTFPVRQLPSSMRLKPGMASVACFTRRMKGRRRLHLENPPSVTACCGPSGSGRVR